MKWCALVPDGGLASPYHRRCKMRDDGFREGRTWFGALDFALAAVAVCLGAVRSQSATACAVVACAQILVLTATLGAIVTLRPYAVLAEQLQASAERPR